MNIKLDEVPNELLLSILLDNECDPQNPYEINLHCASILIYWEMTEHNMVEYDGIENIKWNKYKINKIEVLN